MLQVQTCYLNVLRAAGFENIYIANMLAGKGDKAKIRISPILKTSTFRNDCD
jgi:hypothetical protein